MFAKLSLDTGEYEKGLDKASGSASSFGSKFGKAVKGVGTVIAGIGTTATALGSTIFSLASQTADFGDVIDKESQKVGMSTSAFQKWDYVMNLAGTSMQDCTIGMKTMTNQIDAAKNGGEDAQKMFAKLGISMDDLNTLSREDIFGKAINGLQGMAESTERAALAGDMFGRSGQNLTPLFNMTADETNALMQNFEDLGNVMSEDAVKNSAAFRDAITTLKATFTGLKNNLVGEFLPSLTTVMDGITKLVSGQEDATATLDAGLQEFASNLSGTLNTALSTIVELLPSLITAVTTLVGSIAEQLPALMTTITAAITDTLLPNLLDMMPDLLNSGVLVIVNLINGISTALPTLIPKVIEIAISLVNTLIENLPLILDAGMQLLDGLIEGLLAAIPMLIDALPKIIDAILNFITANLGKIIEMGINLVVKLAFGLIKAIPQLVAKIPQIISSIVSALGKGLSAIANVGGNLLRGLWQGIQNAKQWLIDRIKGLGSTIMGAIKGIFGIHSPSRVMRDEIGKNLALGLGIGFEETMDDVNKDMLKALPTFDNIPTAEINANAIYGTSGIGGTLTDVLRDALNDVAVVMDGKAMGKFVNKTVAQAVYG